MQQPVSLSKTKSYPGCALLKALSVLVPVILQIKARIFVVMRFSPQDLYFPSPTHLLWAGPGLAVPPAAGVLR